MRRSHRITLLFCCWLLPGAAVALPEDPGALKVQTLARQLTLAGKAVAVDLYLPVGIKAPAPVVALGHGFARGRAQMAGWGKLLASRGFVAAAPTFPGPMPDHTINRKVMAGLLDWMVAEGKKKASPLFGKVDGGRRGVMGHSAGGLASVLAAASDARIGVVVGLDPVDAGNLGQAAAPKVKAPATFLLAESHMCNSNSNAQAVAAALGGPLFSLRVRKATHCDPENPSDGLCSLACGAADAKRQARFRRYAVATLDHVLRCAPGMATYLGGAAAKGDTLIQAGKVKGFPPKQQGCKKPPTDAGTPDVAGPKPDAPKKPDLGPKPDAKEALDTTAAADGAPGLEPTPAGQEGCSCATSGQPPAAWPLLLLALLLRRGRRR